MAGEAEGIIAEVGFREILAGIVRDMVMARPSWAQVRGAGGEFGALFGPGQRGQQQAGEDRDNGDHDEQFDQGEGARTVGHQPCGCRRGLGIEGPIGGAGSGGRIGRSLAAFAANRAFGGRFRR